MIVRMSKKEPRTEYKFLLLFMQLGMTIVFPILLCLFIGLYLKKEWNVPDAIFAVLILFGVAMGILSAWRMIIKITKP